MIDINTLFWFVIVAVASYLAGAVRTTLLWSKLQEKNHATIDAYADLLKQWKDQAHSQMNELEQSAKAVRPLGYGQVFAPHPTGQKD